MLSTVEKREELNGKIVFTTIEYCSICKSTNIKVSSKWNKYCWDICWKKKEYDSSYSMERFGEIWEMCVEH